MDEPEENLTDAKTIQQTVHRQSLTTETDGDPLVGLMLDGRYLVKRKLGSGGFGVVYLASDEKMVSRPVVVKTLRGGEIRNEWSVKTFKREIESLTRVDHPSIVGIFDVGELPDGSPYIVMQYVDGFSLRSVIRNEGMDFQRAANIIRQTGRALSAAHDCGILHRDLKPENIMVQTLGDGEEQVKIIDFGIASVKNSVVSLDTTSGRTVGTIAYMSPEQLSAGHVSQPSDVYCFAVIAYELLTGRRPAQPEFAYQLLEMQRSGVRVKPGDLRPGLPKQADSIILKALSFESKDRYQRARDFGDLLSSALTDDDEQTVPAGDPKLEIAHVLFMDIVGFAKKLIDVQPVCLQKLQEIVGGTEDFRRLQTSKQLIRLSTGDGIALVFFGDPEAPIRCALAISQALKECPEIGLRMGIHSGLVRRVTDINTNVNVAGGGINIAQRVMDCGDAGHILVSERSADDLRQLAQWSSQLHDLGEAEVKHGFRVHLFNLYTDELGNPELPTKLRPAASRYSSRLTAIAATVIGAALIGTVAFFALRPRVVTPPPVAPVVVPAPLREQSLTYWLTVQKMGNKRPVGEPFDSAGDVIFGNGWKFRFNFQPAQNGALYLLNEGPGADNKTEYNVLFPNPQDNGGLAGLAANQQLNAGWFRFVDKTGAEKLWLVWASKAPEDLDAVFRDAANHGGVIGDVGHIETVQKYLKQYDKESLEVVADKSRRRTMVKGKGDVVVDMVELAHEAY